MQINCKHFFWFSLLAATLLISPALISGQAGGTQPLITQPVNENQRTVLKGNTYPLARPQYDRGPAPASLPMDRMVLVLKRSPQQQAALAALLQQQQVKASPGYHKWLTPAEFGQQFGESNQDVQTIASWLESEGFQVDRVANGRGVIEFSGSAGQVQQAFHTAIHKYVVKGKAHWANASDPQIPTALAPAVAGILSLNNFPRKVMHRVAGIFRRSKATGQAIPVQQPAYTLACGSGNCYALGPYDFATIYNVLPLWKAGIDGTGQTIAIVGESDINPQDVDEFRSLFGMPAPNVNVIHNGPDPGILSSTGDETESDLDVEWAGAVAKGATIDFVVSESTEATQGVDLSAEYIVDRDLAPVMSMSYGECELDLGTAGNQFYNQLWQQAAAEGITALVATGDGGSALCDEGATGATDGLAVNGLSSTPYDLAVGGTDFSDALDESTYWSSTNDTTTGESAIGYIPEAAWNDTCTNPELAQISGFSANAEANCNNSSLTAQYPFLLQVFGGTGGASNCITSTGQSLTSCGGGYAKPAWQSGTGVPNDSVRDVPDVSLFAGDGFNGNFYIVCDMDQFGGTGCSSRLFLGVGGTSASTPVFAGILAMVNQKTKSRQGNANYVLYPLAAKTGASCASAASPAATCIFYDETSGTIAMPCVSGSPDCATNTAGDGYGVLSGYANTTGYDPANGLGSVNAANLVNDWSSITFTPTTTTLQLNGGNAVNAAHGAAVSVNISVTPGSPAPSGTVSLIAEDGGTNFDAGTFTLSNGVASGTTTLLPGGTSYNVIARYAGDGTYGASDSSPVTVTVGSEASKTFANLVTFDNNGNLTSRSASSATYGTGYSLLRIDVGDSSATYSSATGISSSCSNHTASCPTGAVAVTVNGTPLPGGNLPLSINGYAEDQSLVPGTYAVSANYPGDSSYDPSTGSASFTIAKAPTTVIPGVTSLQVQYGDSEEIAATVITKSNGVAPTGTFTFSLNGNPLTVSAMGYEGFPYNPNGSPPYATYAVTASAYFLQLGSNTLGADYSGDKYYAAGTGSSTFNVTQALPRFGAWGASPNAVDINQQVTLTASLLGSDEGVAPTGTITFYNGDTALNGTVSYTTSGRALQASMPFTPTKAGTYNINAKYLGDKYYLPATTPGSVTLTVTGPDFSLTAPVSLNINIGSPGDSGSTGLSVAALLGFTGTVKLTTTCPDASYEITCSISPTSVDLTSSTTSASTTLTVDTTAPSLLPPSGEPAGPGWPGNGWEITLACVFGLAMMLLWIRRHRPERRWRSAFALLALASALALASCGGGGGQSTPPAPTDPGTPTGSYTVTVTATSGSLSHSTNITINVQ